MLREIRSPFLSPRLIGVRYTTSSGAVTVNTGVGEVTGTSTSTGRADISLSKAFSRSPCLVANTATAMGNGSFIGGSTNNVYPSATGFNTLSKDNGGSGAYGTVHALILGYDSRDSTRYKRGANVVKCGYQNGILHAFRVNTSSPGTISINNANASLVRNGTGDVTITLKTAAAAPSMVIVATPVKSTTCLVNVTSVTGSSFRIRVDNVSGTATDSIVNILCLVDGGGVAERVAGSPLFNSQRKPILFGYSTKYTLSTPAFDFNSGDASLLSAGTGRCAFTFNAAFRREPIIVAMPVANSSVNYCTIDNSSASGFEVKCFNGAGSLANPSTGAGFQVIGVGWDDPSEY